MLHFVREIVYMQPAYSQKQPGTTESVHEMMKMQHTYHQIQPEITESAHEKRKYSLLTVKYSLQ